MGVQKPGFLRQYFVTAHRCGQKPGFFDRREAQKPGFSRQYFVTAHRCGQKPGFFDYRSPLTPSNRRKCTLPDRSPATTVTPSGAIAQHSKALSPLKLATSLPLNRSQTLRVLSSEAEIASLPSNAIATACTALV